MHPLKSTLIGGSSYSNILESARAAIMSSPLQSPPSPSLLLKHSAADLESVFSSSSSTSSASSPLRDVAALVRALQATPHSAKHIALLPSLQARLGHLSSRSDVSAAFLYSIVESIQLNPQLKSTELLKAAESAFEAFEQGGAPGSLSMIHPKQQNSKSNHNSGTAFFSSSSSMLSTSVASSTNRVFSNYISVLGLYGLSSRADPLVTSLVRRGIWPERTLLNSLVRSHTLSGSYAKAFQWYSALPEFGVQPNAKSKALLASLIISAEESGKSLGLRALVRETSVFGFYSHFSTHGSDDSSVSASSSSEMSDGSRDDSEGGGRGEGGRVMSSFSSSSSSSSSTAPIDLYVGLLMRPFIPEHSEFLDHHHHHHGGGGGGGVSNSNGVAVVNERFSALDSALNVATSLCLADPDGRAFKTLWRDDLRATLVRAAYLEPDVTRIFGAGRRSAINAAFKSLAISRQLMPATQRKRTNSNIHGNLGGSRKEKDRDSTPNRVGSVVGMSATSSSTTTTIWKSVEADAVRSRALALIRKVNSALETLQSGIGARVDPSATARSLLVSRSSDVIRLLRAVRIEPKQAVLGAYVRTVVLGGQPHMLRQALSLVSERPSGAAASHISDVLRSACTPQFASAVYSLLPELTAVGIRPSGDVLGELIEAATKAWVAGQVYSCPACLELIGGGGGGGGGPFLSKTQNSSSSSVVTRSLQYEAKRSQSTSKTVEKSTDHNLKNKASTLSSTNKIVIDDDADLVEENSSSNNNSNGEFIDVLPSSSSSSTSFGDQSQLSRPNISSSSSFFSSSTPSSSSSKSAAANARNLKNDFSSTPPWALDGAKPSASALAAISNASVRCIAGQTNTALSSIGSDSSSSYFSYSSSSSSSTMNLTLYPSRQLAVLSATGLLGSVPESALVQLAQAAANSLCGREAWTVWQHMRHLKLHAAHLDRALLRQLTLAFIAGRLQLPAWEAFLVLYPRPASKLTILPSLETISALVEAEAAAEAPQQPFVTTKDSSSTSAGNATNSSSSSSLSRTSHSLQNKEEERERVNTSKAVVESTAAAVSKFEEKKEEEKEEGKVKGTKSKSPVPPVNITSNTVNITSNTVATASTSSGTSGSLMSETSPTIDDTTISITVSQQETKRRYIPHHFRSKCTQRTPLSEKETLSLSHIAVPVSQGRYFRSTRPVCVAKINKNMLELQSDFERVAADIQKALIVGARQSPKAGLEHVLVNGSSLVQVAKEHQPDQHVLDQQQQRQLRQGPTIVEGSKNSSSNNSSSSSNNNSSSSRSKSSFTDSSSSVNNNSDQNIVTIEIYLSIPAWIEGKHIIPGDDDFNRILDEARDRLVSSGSIRVKLPPVGAGAKDESWRVGRLEIVTAIGAYKTRM